MATEVKVPSVGESITEVTIASWLKKDGDYVKMDEPICEIESDKATVEVAAPIAGVLKILIAAGETVGIGVKMAEVDETASAGAPTAAAATTPKEAAAPVATAQASTSSGDKNFPSPAAAKILSEKGVDASSVQGTGRDGRITKGDALSAKAEAPVANSSTASKVVATISGDRSERIEKMTSLRKTIARRLLEARNGTAMLTTFNEIDMSAVMDLRKKYKDVFKEKHEVGLGFMSFFTKAVCMALKDFPIINAQIDGENLVYHDFCDVGVAVSTPRGLVVPVIRNAEHLSLSGIEKAILELAKKGRDNKLKIEDMQGGTFTITNGGTFGSMMSTPIINIPQSAILGMHNIVDRAVVVNGEIKVRPVMYVALSYDHRLIDGKDSVGFLVRVKQLIEDPSRLLLDV